ncbi:MAG: hypothetical protein IPP51_00520 [Bacteroidetes bacterium]|nr:hypothetical protein [Bacteroidota bacterium]
MQKRKTFPNTGLLLLICLFPSLGIAQKQSQFTLISPEESQVTFQNKLTETEEINILNYEYFYNGGGCCRWRHQ